jgi:hypothetical protein
MNSLRNGSVSRDRVPLDAAVRLVDALREPRLELGCQLRSGRLARLLIRVVGDAAARPRVDAGPVGKAGVGEALPAAGLLLQRGIQVRRGLVLLPERDHALFRGRRILRAAGADEKGRRRDEGDSRYRRFHRRRGLHHDPHCTPRKIHAPRRPVFTLTLSARHVRFPKLGDDCEVRIDDVGDLVFDGLSHQHRRGALVESVIAHQPSQQLRRGVLERLQ